jgi:hypothetical protein
MEIEKVDCNGGTRIRILNNGREIVRLWRPFFGGMQTEYVLFGLPVELLQEALDFIKENK